MSRYKNIYHLFFKENKLQLIKLLVTMLGMGFLQTAGILSILPFIAVLSSPQLIFTNNKLHALYVFFNFNNQNSFLFFLGLCVLFVLIFGNAYFAVATRHIIRFRNMHIHSLSLKLLSNYLQQPYIFFLNQNSAVLANNIITEVNRCVAGILTPLLDIVTRSIITLCILALLVSVDPLLAIIVLLVCGGSYAVVYKLTRRSLAVSGKKSTESQSLRVKKVHEAFGGIKDIKLTGRESQFIKDYEVPSNDFVRSQTTMQTIAELPKFALEIIVFGGILLIMLYLIGLKQNISSVLPLLALYAFTGYRLMPSLERIFAGLATLRFSQSVLDLVYDDLQQCNSSNKYNPAADPGNTVFEFNESLALKNISFAYPGSDTTIIKNVNIEIKPNTTIGFVGATGSGKTTLIDIILGLLPIQTGKISVDNNFIDNKNIRKWMNNIGYVPQHIYLADDTIAKNIAFGIPKEEIIYDAVIKAAQLANIDKFIINNLPDGYDTYIGERGIRLSGGQQQRIGIARALYNDPEVLVLDEATSALDGSTENAIMGAIHNLAHKKTIIMIAHRITTVKDCDTIYVMESGVISESGTYNELMASSKQFREMANVSKPGTN
jgi:ABC-type multidrug transport system fused ATPase/permease subunit